MAGLDTSAERTAIFKKNFNVVCFLAESSKPTTNLLLQIGKEFMKFMKMRLTTVLQMRDLTS